MLEKSEAILLAAITTCRKSDAYFVEQCLSH